MPFIRLCDSYIDHPKFTALSASAFRLWHEGMAFCRKHQTDGLMSLVALKGFRYYQPALVKELAQTLPGEGGPLWETIDAFGFKIRNYLSWNLSKEESEREKEGGKARSKRWREQRSKNIITNTVRNASPHAYEPNKDMDLVLRSSEGVQGKPDPANPVGDTIAARAAAFLEKYAELYAEHRQGARMLKRASNVDWVKACELCGTWDDERLTKLAEIFLTTDEKWISGTGREFNVFHVKAQWCEDRLAEWEAKQKRAS